MSTTGLSKINVLPCGDLSSKSFHRSQNIWGKASVKQTRHTQHNCCSHVPQTIGLDSCWSTEFIYIKRRIATNNYNGFDAVAINS